MAQRAVEVYVNPFLDEQVRYDSSMVLIDEALELYPENLNALGHRLMLFQQKRDINEVLSIADQMIAVSPESPLLLGQKAFMLELNGDLRESRNYYDQAFRLYEKYLKEGGFNFNLTVEYADLLKTSGDSVKARKTLEAIDTTKIEDIQKDLLRYLRQRPDYRERMRKFWDGEIEFDQIEMD